MKLKFGLGKEKKINKGTVILIIIVLLAVTGITVISVIMANKDNSPDTENTKFSTVDQVNTTETQGDYSVQGFFPGGVGSSGGSQKNVCGIELPYNIPTTEVTLLQLGQYTGPFVEDGSDTPKANIFSAILKNNSEKTIEYFSLVFKTSEDKKITFNISLLPANATVLVMEASGKEFSPTDMLEYDDSLISEYNGDNSVMDKVSVSCDKSGKLSLTNTSDEDLGTVYVRYKNCFENNVFIGGIAYSVKFDNVSSGSTVTCKTNHYSKDESKLLAITR